MLRPYSRGVVRKVFRCVAVGQTRRRGRRRYTRGVSIGRRDRAGHAAPRLSCAIQVHSASQMFFRQNSWTCFGALPFGAKLGVGARSAFSIAATAAAWGPRETPPEEILPYPAANSSARGSPPAGALHQLQADRHNAREITVEESFACHLKWRTVCPARFRQTMVYF